MNTATARPSFRLRVQEMREQAVISAVNRMLSTKGFDGMTVDEVAAEVGIAKASLYKLYESKEALACAAMVAAMNRGVVFLESLDPGLSAVERLRAVVRWLMTLRMQGEMPNLPARNSALRAMLTQSPAYMNSLMTASEMLTGWIVQAQEDGDVSRQLPPLVVLYTCYARACDPVLDFLRDSNLHSDEEIIELVMQTCFGGLSSRDSNHGGHGA
jgi:AcrR family transcriptional regulator